MGTGQTFLSEPHGDYGDVDALSQQMPGYGVSNRMRQIYRPRNCGHFVALVSAKENRSAALVRVIT
jgi:hypothetical protein